MAEEHPAPARLGALPDDHLHGVRLAQVVRVHAVAGGEELVDEDLRVLAFLGRHAAVARRRRRPHLAGPAPERLLGRRRQGAEAHPRDRHRDLQLERLLGEAGSKRHVGVAALAVALERIAGDAGAEEEQIVEVRQMPLRPEAADVVDALACGALDLRDDSAVEEIRLAQVPGTIFGRCHQYFPALSTWKL